jgi:hypothetical protein
VVSGACHHRSAIARWKRCTRSSCGRTSRSFRAVRAPLNFSPAEYAGFQHTLYRQEYQKALEWDGFCGGTAAISNWLNRDDLVRCLRHFGFSNLRFNFDDPSHPNGPALAIIAARH